MKANARALVMCKQGHTHRGAQAAHLCNVAWRRVEARRLGADKLAADILAALKRRSS